MTVKRPETYARMDSFMTEASNASRESNAEYAEKKQRRMSRFREELDVGDE